MLSLLQTSCACSLGFFIAKVLERDDCIYFIFAQLPVSYSFVQCSRHSTPSVIDLGRVTSNLLVTKSCPLMLLFTLDLLASVNTVDYSLLLNTLSMTSLSSFPPPFFSGYFSNFPSCAQLLHSGLLCGLLSAPQDSPWDLCSLFTLSSISRAFSGIPGW